MSRMSRTSSLRRVRMVRWLSALAMLALLAAACGGGAEEAEPAAEEPAATDAAEEPAATEDAAATAPADGTDAATEAAAGDADFYQEGDTVQLVVPFDTGGGTDTIARIIGPPLSECIGADIQVRNVPGGGSVLGANEFVNAMEHDGYNLLMTSASTHVPPIVGQAAVEYGFDVLEPVVGFPQGGVIYASEQSPIDEATDLAAPNQPEQITYGGQPATGGELRILLIFEMLGTDVNPVLGYEGRGPARIALERGESDIGYDTNSAYIANVQPLVDEGVVVPLMSFGQVEDGQIVDDPNFPDLPNPAEVYEEAYGESPEGNPAYEAYVALSGATLDLNKAMSIHPDAPEEAKAELTQCWQQLQNDEEFLDQLENETGVRNFYTGEQLESVWNSVAAINIESEAVQWLLQWVQDTYGVQLQEGD